MTKQIRQTNIKVFSDGVDKTEEADIKITKIDQSKTGYSKHILVALPK